MAADPNPNLPQQAESQGRQEDILFLALVKWVIVGLGVGLVGVAMCVPLFYILGGLRELGLLLTFFVIPVSVLATRAFTRRYLRRGTLSAAIVVGLRYLLVGGWLALVIKVFVLGGEISDTPFIVCLGGAIGAMCGSLGGAFQGWLQSGRRPSVPCDSRLTTSSSRPDSA